VIVAQISDMHVKRRGHVLHHMPHVAGPLRRALAAIAKLQPAPDCIIATGDLTEGGATAEYARLRELIESCPLPIYLIPGNHDRADALRSAFAGHRYLFQSPCGICYTIERERLRVIALDSSSEGDSGGWLDRSRLDWLRRCLRERPSPPTILALHHPPFPTGVRRFDRQRFEGRSELATIVETHSQIRRVICGHVHQPLARPWCGTLGITAPSTAPTLTLHAQRSGLSWEPGGFLLHRYERGTGVTTTLMRTSADPIPLSA
jgi:3',5'-cyclic-AMP phosphodiesterase